MEPVREKDHEHAACRIDPDRGPRESRVAERSERQEFAAVHRIRRIDVPAEAADIRLAGRRCRRRHPADGQRRQNARSVDRTAAEQHAAVEREIRRGAEEPRVPGNASHPPRGRIVHDAAQHLHLGPPFDFAHGRPFDSAHDRPFDAAHGRPFDAAHGRLARIAERRARLGRRDARDHRRRRVERGLLHPERQKHALADELLERLFAHAADDLGKQEIVDVAVDEAAARRRGQHFFGGEPNRFVVAAPVEADIHVRSETRHVRQKIAHRDAILPVLREIRNERGDRVGEPHLPFLHQHHHRRRRRDDFRERRDVEDRVECHRLASGHDRAIAICLTQHDRVAPADDDDRAGELAFLDGLGDDVIEAGQAGWIEARIIRKFGGLTGERAHAPEPDRTRGRCEPPAERRHFCLDYTGRVRTVRAPEWPDRRAPPTPDRAHERPSRHDGADARCGRVSPCSWSGWRAGSGGGRAAKVQPGPSS